jgi:lipopolysaccharide/colanic/teichoic acid biosynthesis glycosyltransferase
VSEISAIHPGKRLFDLIVTCLSAVVWVPALLLCAAAIALCEGRPVFYVSNRFVGARMARVPKFRTMVRDAERLYNRDTVPVSDNIRFLNVPRDSPLYTRVGRLIERLALTELPQLLLVLRGDMSLVGSRPLPENVVQVLREAFPDAHDRFLTPAGMTGPVQLVGRWNLPDRDRLTLEAAYCRIALTSPTWRLDFLILLYTVLLALRLRKPLAVEEVRALMARLSQLGRPRRRTPPEG